VNVCEKIHATTRKNMKIDILSEYLCTLDDESLPVATLFFSGRTFPRGSKLKMNIGFSTIMQSLSEIASLDTREIQQSYLKYGDLGALSEYAVLKKHVIPLFKEEEQQPLTLAFLYNQLKKIAGIIGAGSGRDKKSILKALLVNSLPLEAKYLIKIINGEMRIGLIEGLVELAIAKAFNQNIKDVREAMLISGDIAEVSLLAKRGSLNTLIIKPLSPLSFMLADVMFTAEEIIKYYQKPLICEYKYDGIRIQMHKFGQEIRMFSRRLADVTDAFPELVSAALHINSSNNISSAANDDDSDIGNNISSSSASSKSIDFILDGEVLAFQGKKPLHFKQLQKRLHKKNVTEQVTMEIPLIYVVYDIMYLSGGGGGEEQVIKKSLKERKQILSSISFKEPFINSSYKIVNSIQEISEMFDKSKDIGHEGLMLKEPDSQYHPGKRGRYWTKLKRELDTIDAVIVMAEYGHGKRAGVLSDYTFAVRDESSSSNNVVLRTIGKAYSGLTDDEINEMTSKLKLLMINDYGYRITVKPEIVLEIAFDSIQKSSRHDSGFAMRFPRIKSIRNDKNVVDIDTLGKVKQIYEKQVYLISKKEGEDHM
jgi:DNA ligase-1